MYVLHFGLKRFSNLEARETKCRLVERELDKGRGPFSLLPLELPISLVEDQEAL